MNPCEGRDALAGLRRRHDPGAVQEGVHPVEFRPVPQALVPEQGQRYVPVAPKPIVELAEGK